jgi:predicted NBD/HSP70 family sugar kinase
VASGVPDKTTLTVFRHLVDHGPLSRPALGAGTGLARATTSAIVNDLMRRGLVTDLDVVPTGGRGRPVKLLDLDDDRYAITGLEIGFGQVTAAVYSLRGRTLFRMERSVRVEATNPRALLRQAAGVLYEALDQVEDDERELLGVGVSVAGLVDASSGTIKYAPNLGWRDVALSAGVAEALGGRAPVLLDSTANFAALAERRHRNRNGTPTDSLVYLTGTYGISAGIITGADLWRGENGTAGEVGHLIIDPDGKPCVCGRRGCFDTRAGVSAIVEAALDAARRPRRSGCEPSALTAAVEEVAALAAGGDAAVIGALAEAGMWLGRGAALVAAILDPKTIVIGGLYTRLAPWLLAPAREAFGRALLMPGPDGDQLDVSVLDAWAPAEGAALAVLLSIADGSAKLPG